MRKASNVPHNNNQAFDNLCQASDFGHLKKSHLSPFYTRPIYQYTSMEMGGRDATYRERTHRRGDH